MLSAQEVHYYNRIVKSEKLHNLIVCPVSSTDIITLKLDEDDRIYFYCISCKATFKLNRYAEDSIKEIIQTYINKNVF